ncbi:MAG: hypothetical protein ABIH69_01695 [bacterium]|nr:hypothetical protein [Candidatus Margulisiibacteriota bacterium]
MSKLKSLKRPKCDCGGAVVEGSVFCLCCRAAIKRKNDKILEREKDLFVKKK